MSPLKNREGQTVTDLETAQKLAPVFSKRYRYGSSVRRNLHTIAVEQVAAEALASTGNDPEFAYLYRSRTLEHLAKVTGVEPILQSFESHSRMECPVARPAMDQESGVLDRTQWHYEPPEDN